MGCAEPADRRRVLKDVLAAALPTEQLALKAMQGQLLDIRNMGEQLALELLAAIGLKAEELAI